MGIKPLELDPTRENVFNTLVTDAVGRNRNLWQFACFCSAQKNRCSIALDSGWGTGKTFFLKQLQMLFDVYGDQPERVKQDEQKQLQILFNSYAAEDQLGMTIKHHVCVYYDAWLNDNADDPLHSILYELIKQTKTRFVKNGKGDYWKAACAIFDAFTGKNTSCLLDLAKGTNPVYDIKNQQSFHERFADFLDNLVPKGYGRLLVLIDELDRCKPTYAVQLLERIKHYLSNDKITFVFAINDEQLQHTIKAFYGDGFNAHQYLDRFFDHRLMLPQIDDLKFKNYYGLKKDDNESPICLYTETCDSFLRLFPLSMREELKYRSQVKIICDSACKDRRFVNNSCWWLVVFVFIPFLLGLKLKDRNMYNDFVDGRNKEPILPVIARSRHITCLLSDPNHYRTSPQVAFVNIDAEKASKNFDRVYQCLFVDQLKEQTHAEFPPFFLDREMRDVLLSALGFMADFIKYETNTEEPAHG